MEAGKRGVGRGINEMGSRGRDLVVSRVGGASGGSVLENWILVLPLLQGFFHDIKEVTSTKAFTKAMNRCSSGGTWRGAVTITAAVSHLGSGLSMQK